MALAEKLGSLVGQLSHGALSAIAIETEGLQVGGGHHDVTRPARMDAVVAFELETFAVLGARSVALREHRPVDVREGDVLGFGDFDVDVAELEEREEPDHDDDEPGALRRMHRPVLLRRRRLGDAPLVEGRVAALAAERLDDVPEEQHLRQREHDHEHE